MKLSTQRLLRAEASLDIAGTLYVGPPADSGFRVFDLADYSPRTRLCVLMNAITGGGCLFGSVQEANFEHLNSITSAFILRGAITELSLPNLTSLTTAGGGFDVQFQAASLNQASVERVLQQFAAASPYGSGGPTINLTGGNAAPRRYLYAAALTGGTGYTVGDTFALEDSYVDGSNCLVTVNAVDENGAITSVEITAPGDFTLLQADPPFAPVSVTGSGFSTSLLTLRNDAIATLEASGWVVLANPQPV